MSFSAGVFSINSSGQPVVTGTVISSTAFNALTADLATGLTTCLLKDGTQTVTANIPMSSFKFTGLAAGSTAGNSLRYEQLIGLYQLLSTYTTAGDIVQATGSGATARLGIGTARQQLAVNSGATAVEYVASLQSLMSGTGDIVQSSGANTPARLAIGTASQVLQVNSGATASEWANRVTLGTPTASTSGTSIDFTGIPASASKITINFVGVSTNGTSHILFQLGDAGDVEATGYLGSGTQLDGAPSTTNYTTGFGLQSALAANVIHGSITFSLENSAAFTWCASGTFGASSGPAGWVTSGSKSTSAALTRVRVTTVNGSDAFDAGEINISYE